MGEHMPQHETEGCEEPAYPDIFVHEQRVPCGEAEQQTAYEGA